MVQLQMGKFLSQRREKFDELAAAGCMNLVPQVTSHNLTCVVSEELPYKYSTLCSCNSHYHPHFSDHYSCTLCLVSLFLLSVMRNKKVTISFTQFLMKNDLAVTIAITSSGCGWLLSLEKNSHHNGLQVPPDRFRAPPLLSTKQKSRPTFEYTLWRSRLVFLLPAKFQVPERFKDQQDNQRSYWKPTGKPRVIMARDQDIEIGKKRTLTTFVLCKLKRKFGKAEVSCIEEGQPSHYLPPNLGNYIANNANQAEAARCLTANSNPNEMLTQLEALNDHEELEHQSIEWGIHMLVVVFLSTMALAIAEPMHHLLTEIPMGQEVLQDQSGTNEQDISNLGDLGPGMKEAINIRFITFAGPSTDEEAQGNRIEQMIDDWILDEGIPNAFDNHVVAALKSKIQHL
ncbi:hypothetical protein CXB51_031057 [Gossypium anomalum]|uniref:Uncharacterized protein n=1 Tax=Gossypium anomalum TaxID=47600 RepID=A0A8J6CMA4_9ROSI|nr:hypothetical protein CXB51_031057 [Gossypium anomalum]